MAERNAQDAREPDRDDAVEALEAELASFEPSAISDGLRRRIGSDLADRGPRPRIAAALGGLLAAAASVAVGILVWRAGDDGRDVTGKPPVPVAVTGPTGRATAAPADPSPPTVMELQRAIAGSPAALDELLAWPAGRGRGVGRRELGDVATAFTRSANLPDITTTNGDAR